MIKAFLIYSACLLFSGMVFGIGLHKGAVGLAYDWGKNAGAESVILQAIEKDGKIEIVSR